MLHYVWNSQSPITPTNFVEAKRWKSRFNYMSWLTILSNMNIFCHDFREVGFTRFYYATHFRKQWKSHNSYKFCRFKIVAQQAQLHAMTNNPTIYEHIPSFGFRLVVSTDGWMKTDAEWQGTLKIEGLQF